jgi:DNA-binding transcriptional LysR family regulator
MTKGSLRPVSRTLDLVTLRLVLAAIEEGNLAKVAARENISLSAVSRRISDLEGRLGVQLLHRYDRGVAPTAAASKAAAPIRDVFRLLDAVMDDFQDVRDGTTGLVRLHAHLTAVVGPLPARLAQFRSVYPGIETVIEERTSVDILHAVQVGECDIGLVSGTVAGGSLTLIPWGSDRLVAVMPTGHVLEALDSVRFTDVLEFPFIGMTQGSALDMLYCEQAAELGRTLDQRAHVSSFEGVRAIVAAGLGLGIMPSSVVPSEPQSVGLAIRPLAESWASRPLMICVRDLRHISGATRHLIDHLRADEPAS